VKFPRLIILSLAVIALLGGCGSSNEPTGVRAPTLDTAPPPAPEGLSATIDPAVPSAVLKWAPSTDPEVVGYEVYEYAPDPTRENAFVLADALEGGTTSWNLPGVTKVTVKYFRVSAVSKNGEHSALSTPCKVTLQPGRSRLPFEG